MPRESLQRRHKPQHHNLKQKKDDKDKKDAAKADDTAAAEPTAEPEAPSGGGIDPDNPDMTPKDDGGGDILWRCRMYGTTAKDCRKEIRGKLGSNDPRVLKEDMGRHSNPFPTYDTGVKPLDPYILTETRGGSHTIGIDSCGGGIVSGRTAGNTFCHRVADGGSRCDGGGSAPVAPRGGTEPGDNPIPNPGPGPRLGR